VLDEIEAHAGGEYPTGTLPTHDLPGRLLGLEPHTSELLAFGHVTEASGIVVHFLGIDAGE
jgi:hypothetical protein